MEVLSAALQQANAEKAVLATDKARLEQEIARLRLQMSVMEKALALAPNGHAASPSSSCDPIAAAPVCTQILPALI